MAHDAMSSGIAGQTERNLPERGEESPPAGDGSLTRFSPRKAWGAVLLLMVVGVINTVDRALPGILVEPIKHELGLSDTAIGLINGFGFLVVYALVGIPIARIADRGAYGLVVSVCLGLWSLMTVLGSATQTGLQFAITRMGVALGEAGFTPASHAFIARNFKPEARGTPLAVLTLSLPIAICIGFWLGAYLGETIGWRSTFLVMGLFGLALAPLVLFVLGPRQALASAGTAKSMSFGPVRQLLKKPSFLLIMAGGSAISMGGYVLVSFTPAFLMRVHGMQLGEVGALYGLASGIAGGAGLLISGLLADRLSRRDPRWSLWVVSLMIAAVLPFGYAAFLVENSYLAIAMMAVYQIIGVAYFAPVIAATHRLAPEAVRATASAVLLAVGALTGGIGPLLAGIISDSLQAELGDRAIGTAMLVSPAFFTVAGLLFLLANITYQRDVIKEGS